MPNKTLRTSGFIVLISNHCATACNGYVGKNTPSFELSVEFYVFYVFFVLSHYCIRMKFLLNDLLPGDTARDIIKSTFEVYGQITYRIIDWDKCSFRNCKISLKTYKKK